MNKKPRPNNKLDGATFKLKVPGSNDDPVNLYLTINHDGKGNAFEIFINCIDKPLYEHMELLTLQVTSMLRRGLLLSEIAEDLENIYSPTTSHFKAGKKEKCKSIYDSISDAFKSFDKYFGEIYEN